MYVILTQDVVGVGSKNTLMKVSDGYYDNFLAPKRYAKIATSAMIESLKATILAQKEQAKRDQETMTQVAQSLQNASITLSAKASEKGTLFKALGEKDVVAALKKQHGIQVEKDDVSMDHFKKLGDFTATVTIAGKEVKIQVHVEAKD